MQWILTSVMTTASQSILGVVFKPSRSANTSEYELASSIAILAQSWKTNLESVLSSVVLFDITTEH